MGLFFPSDPIIHGQRAKGLPRYQELLERDWKSFLIADFVTLGLCIPYGLGVGYALLSSSLLVLLPVLCLRWIPKAALIRSFSLQPATASVKPLFRAL